MKMADSTIFGLYTTHTNDFTDLLIYLHNIHERSAKKLID